jgi:MerR family transcriptional regulator, redox-sensitive transcriptional activator SoxR
MLEVKCPSRYTHRYMQATAQPLRELSVGQVAQRSGVAVSTVHYYEARGLIRSWRSPGNQRRFVRGVLRRIAFIRVAQRAGIPLKEIRDVLSTLPHGRPPTSEDWRRLSSGWRAELDERILRLTQLRDRFDKCIGCGCLSLNACPLRNSDDRLAGTGAGPRLLERRAAEATRAR